MDVLEDKKEKKQAILGQNRRDWKMLMLRSLQQDTARHAEEQRALAEPPPSAPKQEEVVWSARTQEIRNRLTDRKHMAKSRWNDFAGTGGGRGRGL